MKTLGLDCLQAMGTLLCNNSLKNMALWVSREPDTGFNLSIPREKVFLEIYEIGQLIIKAHYQATAKEQ